MKVALVFVGILCLATIASAHHYSPIQPGAILGDPCTMNFVFKDATGHLYIGAAGHCVDPVGERVVTPELGGFGTTVFWRDDSTNFTNPDNATGPLMDFALIRVDDDKQDLVDPSVRFWGGPTGVETAFDPGTLMLHYGQGLIWQATETSRPRYGVLQEEYDAGPFTDWYLGSHVILGGDSGSGLLTGDGNALGTIVTVAATFGNQPGVIGGPTVDLILRTLHEDGFDVELVTAPFSPLADAAGWQQRWADLSVHCQAQPESDPQAPDGCVRQQYYSYHVVDHLNNATEWELYPWPVASNDDPSACPEAPYFPTAMLYPCRVEIIVLDQPEDFWQDNEGRLVLTTTWRSPTQDVDVYLFDQEGQEVARSTMGVGTTETIILESPPRGHYRMVAVPVHYSETDMETLQNGDEGFLVTAALEHEAKRAGKDDNGAPGLSPSILLAGIGLASWAARRRNA